MIGTGATDALKYAMLDISERVLADMAKPLFSDIVAKQTKQFIDVISSSDTLLSAAGSKLPMPDTSEYLEQIRGLVKVLPNSITLDVTKEQLSRVLDIGNPYVMALSKAITFGEYDALFLDRGAFPALDRPLPYNSRHPTVLQSRHIDIARTWRQTQMQVAEDVSIREVRKRFRKQLRQMMMTAFNLVDIKIICFQTLIDYDSIPGDGKPEKIVELIQYAERHNLLSELIATCQEERPDQPWPVV